MRRSVAAFLTLALGAGLIAGCGGSGSQTPAGGDKAANVVIWSWRPQDETIWDAVEQKLQAQGENITIEFRGIKSTEYDSVLQTAMAGEQGPDIFTTRGGSGTSKYANAGQILALNDVVDLSGFDAGTLEQVSSEGKIYAVPFAVQTEHFFYNKEIFDQYGFEEPKSWDDLIKILDTLKADGKTGIAIGGKSGYAINLMVDTLGATQLGEQWAQDAIAGKTNFTDPKFVQVLERVDKLSEYAQKDFMASAMGDARVIFATGDAAMIIDGIWAVETYYLETNPNIKLGSFLAPPVGNEEQLMYSYVDGGYAINAHSKVQEAALKVLAYTATDEFAQLYADTNAEIPGNQHVTFPESKPMLQEAVKTWKEHGLKTNFRIRSPFDAGSPDISTSLSANLQGMFSDQITPQQAAEALQKDLASWYPAFQNQ